MFQNCESCWTANSGHALNAPTIRKSGRLPNLHEQRRRGRRENPNCLAPQPGDVIALNNGRTAACSASIVTATPTITGPCLLGNVRVKAEIDRRVDAYSRAAAIESAGKDDRGLDLIRYRKQFNGTTYYVEEAADWAPRTGADDSVQGLYREARCGARSPHSNRPKRSAGTLQRQPDELQWLLLDCGYGRSGSL
jgi:hypothetical protein